MTSHINKGLLFPHPVLVVERNQFISNFNIIFKRLFQNVDYKQLELMIHDAISGAIATFTLPSKGGYPDFTAQIRPEHVLAQSTPVSITGSTAGSTRAENSKGPRSEFTKFAVIMVSKTNLCCDLKFSSLLSISHACLVTIIWKKRMTHEWQTLFVECFMKVWEFFYFL